MPKYLSTQEASEYTGVPVWRLKRFRSYGGGPIFHRLPARNLKTGEDTKSHPQYLTSELDVWMQAQPGFISTADEDESVTAVSVSRIKTRHPKAAAG